MRELVNICYHKTELKDYIFYIFANTVILFSSVFNNSGQNCKSINLVTGTHPLITIFMSAVETSGQ